MRAWMGRHGRPARGLKRKNLKRPRGGRRLALAGRRTWAGGRNAKVDNNRGNGNNWPRQADGR
eukprot:8100981-Lingulodinium_polyedra.AAC.1